MKRRISRLSTFLLVFAAASSAVISCKVDDSYNLENIADVDTSIQLFGKGISFPVGSTAKIRLDSLISKTGILNGEISDYVKNGDDGSYRIDYSGHYDFTEDVADFNLEDVASAVPDIDCSFSKKAGIAGADYSFDVNFSSLDISSELISKSAISEAAALLGDGDFTVPSTIQMEYEFDPYTHTVDPISLPDQIKSIKSVTLDPNAGIKVDLSIVNPLLKKGTVTPSVSLDISDVFVLKDGNTLDMSKLVLSETNGYTASYTYGISGVNVAKLLSSKTVRASGSIAIKNAVSNKALISSMSGDMALRISVSIVNLDIKSVECEINPYQANINESINIELKETELPEQVKSIKEITFTSDSKLDLTIDIAGLNSIKGLSANLENLSVKFPDNFKIEGEGVSGNTLTISNASLASTLKRSVTVKSVTLPSPANGKLSYKASIPVTAKATASGTINSADIPATADKDLELNASIKGKIKIEKVTAVSDYEIVFSEKMPMLDLSKIGDDFYLDLPEVDASLDITGNLAIPVKGTVSIGDEKFDVNFPYSVDGKNVTEKNSIKIDFNKILNKKPAPEEISLDIKANVDPSRDCIINLANDYKLFVDYAIGLPIQLGKETKLNVRDTLEVGAESFSQYIENNAISFLGTIESTLPLGLGISLELISSDDGGRTFKTIPLKNQARATVNAGGKSDFSLGVELKDGASAANLQGIVLDIDVTSNGQPVHKDDYIMAKLAVSLPNGLTIDPKNNQ